ncbi:cytosine permease [Catenuloplanes japonicus]|uniref:cytosine permease n=1 Tax=Catenuloplanes japonicus TaxID=33876 RepID=UPI000524B0B0|nr:cytosine permease [Catenuloplanes japonicus]
MDDLFTLSPSGRYHYTGGYNPAAIIATAIGAIIAVIPVLLKATDVAQYSWFIGMGLGFVSYLLLVPAFRVRERSGVLPGLPKVKA